MIKNDFTELVKARRSIRKYKPEPLTDEQIQTLLECGFLAPSGSNCQDWHVTVVTSKDYMDRLTESNIKHMLAQPDLPDPIRERLSQPGQSVSLGAPAIFFISCSGEDVNACFLAEHIVLAAQSLGLGTCYLGGVMGYLRSEAGAKFIDELQLPDGFRVLYGIAVGVPDECPDPRPRDFTKVNYIK